jgi:hypothetical protein
MKQVTLQAIDCLNKKCSGRLHRQDGSPEAFFLIKSVNEKADQLVFVRKNDPSEMAVALSQVSHVARDHPRPHVFR